MTGKVPNNLYIKPMTRTLFTLNYDETWQLIFFSLVEYSCDESRRDLRCHRNDCTRPVLYCLSPVRHSSNHRMEKGCSQTILVDWEASS